MTNAERKTYCVVWRSGGTANFVWHRSVGMTEQDARRARDKTARMGYRAMVVRYAESLRIGLPDTYGTD